MLWTVERVASLLRAVQHVDDGAFKKLTEADSSTKLHKHAELAYGWKRVFELVVLDDPTFTELTPQKCSDKVRKLSSNSHLRKEAASHRQKREEENKQLLMDYEKSQRDFLKEQKKLVVAKTQSSQLKYLEMIYPKPILATTIFRELLLLLNITQNLV